MIGVDVAEALFPGRDPLGRALRVGGRRFEVVGLQARLGTAAGASLDRYVWIPLPAFERVFGAPEALQVFGPRPRHRDTARAEDRHAHDDARTTPAAARSARHLRPAEPGGDARLRREPRRPRERRRACRSA